MANHASRRSVLKAIGAAATLPGIVGTAAGTGRDNAPTPRYAAFNVVDLGTKQVQEPGNSQAEAAARVIQEVDPDVLVVNELANNRQEATAPKDATLDDVPTDQTNIEAFVDNYLSEPQGKNLEGIEYEYTLQPESNTGLLPEDDYDFNKDGTAGERPGDAFGFGEYPGHYAFGIASKYPFDEEAIRSFQEFLWDDMPGNLIPLEGEEGVDTEDSIYLTEDELDVFRLSSKTHLDVPFDVDGETVHGLFSHPTPAVFDFANNFNGRWNHDENRFWADYVAGAEYIYDDSGTEGGIDDDASYVLLGDMNAGPGDEPLDPATKYFVDNDDFNTRNLPTSPGGAQLGNQYATANFGGGGSKVDWVLPSPDLSLRSSSVVWPSADANKRGLADDVREASDHRLVWADIATK